MVPAASGQWRDLAIAVLGLIILLSMLVPLGFLLGLHNGIVLSSPTAGTGFVLLLHCSVQISLSKLNLGPFPSGSHSVFPLLGLSTSGSALVFYFLFSGFASDRHDSVPVRSFHPFFFHDRLLSVIFKLLVLIYVNCSLSIRIRVIFGASTSVASTVIRCSLQPR